MLIEFDPAKRATNLAKHQLDLTEAEAVFEGDTLTVEDDRYDYGEQRHRPAGWPHGGGGLDPARRGPPRHLPEESQ